MNLKLLFICFLESAGVEFLRNCTSARKLRHLHDFVAMVFIMKGKPKKCRLCEASFPSQGHLAYHMRSHMENRPFKCESCEKSYFNSGALDTHKRIHTGERPYKCEFCKKSFSSCSSLISHRRIHDEEKPYKCELCMKSFAQQHNLKYHLKSHSGERPYTCGLCPKSFFTSSSLKSHATIHTGEKPYICVMCDKAFSWASSLKSHMVHMHDPKKLERNHSKWLSKVTVSKETDESRLKIHTEERPFTCRFCQKSFKTSSHLKLHIMTHTGEKPHICEICEKSFRALGNLKRHVICIHSRNKLEGKHSEWLKNVARDKRKKSWKHKICDRFISSPETAVISPTMSSYECGGSAESIDHASDKIASLPESKKFCLRSTEDIITKSFACCLCEKLFAVERDFLDHCTSHSVVENAISDWNNRWF